MLFFHYIRARQGVEEDYAIEHAIEREREWEATQRDNPYVDEARYTRLSDDRDSLELREFPERKHKNG